MAKHRIEAAPPPDFPAATLFLDDIEEIARIFREFQLKLVGGAHDQNELEQVTYRVDDWTCDSIDDLKDLGRYKSMLEVRLEGGVYSLTFYHAKNSSKFAGWVTGAPPDVGWEFYGKMLELLQRRRGWWYQRRRPRVIFEKSFEYKSLPSVLKRHGSQIAIAVITAVATLLGTEGAKWLWRYLHR
jgi:hypothetical protein